MMFELEGTHKTLAVDLLDKYMSWRLRDMLEDVESVPELQDVASSCRVLLGFMGEGIE